MNLSGLFKAQKRLRILKISINFKNIDKSNYKFNLNLILNKDTTFTEKTIYRKKKKGENSLMETLPHRLEISCPILVPVESNSQLELARGPGSHGIAKLLPFVDVIDSIEICSVGHIVNFCNELNSGL